MAERSLFVDFMYAVTVGAALPRINEDTLKLDCPLLWGLFFLMSVFLEDFYLYHAKVVPNLVGFPSWRAFILTMSIIVSWYLSQAAFPSNEGLFLLSFAVFFLLKALGGVLMKATMYPSQQDSIFLLPAATAIALAFLRKHVCFSAHPGRLLMVLAPVWLLSVIVWWSMDGGARAARLMEAG